MLVSAVAVKFAQGVLDAFKREPGIVADAAQMQALIQKLIHECGPELAEEVAQYAVDEGVSCCFALLSKLQKKKAANKLKNKSMDRHIPPLTKYVRVPAKI